jgi:hypothetical protein
MLASLDGNGYDLQALDATWSAIEYNTAFPFRCQWSLFPLMFLSVETHTNLQAALIQARGHSCCAAAMDMLLL